MSLFTPPSGMDFFLALRVFRLEEGGKEKVGRRGKRRWKTMPVAVGIHTSEGQKKWTHRYFRQKYKEFSD
jgi:hypothetical protein